MLRRCCNWTCGRWCGQRQYPTMESTSTSVYAQKTKCNSNFFFLKDKRNQAHALQANTPGKCATNNATNFEIVVWIEENYTAQTRAFYYFVAEYQCTEYTTKIGITLFGELVTRGLQLLLDGWWHPARECISIRLQRTHAQTIKASSRNASTTDDTSTCIEIIAYETRFFFQILFTMRRR